MDSMESFHLNPAQNSGKEWHLSRGMRCQPYVSPRRPYSPTGSVVSKGSCIGNTQSFHINPDRDLTEEWVPPSTRRHYGDRVLKSPFGTDLSVMHPDERPEVFHHEMRITMRPMSPHHTSNRGARLRSHSTPAPITSPYTMPPPDPSMRTCSRLLDRGHNERYGSYMRKIMSGQKPFEDRIRLKKQLPDPPCATQSRVKEEFMCRSMQERERSMQAMVREAGSPHASFLLSSRNQPEPKYRPFTTKRAHMHNLEVGNLAVHAAAPQYRRSRSQSSTPAPISDFPYGRNLYAKHKDDFVGKPAPWRAKWGQRAINLTCRQGAMDGGGAEVVLPAATFQATKRVSGYVRSTQGLSPRGLLTGSAGGGTFDDSAFGIRSASASGQGGKRTNAKKYHRSTVV